MSAPDHIVGSGINALVCVAMLSGKVAKVLCGNGGGSGYLLAGRQ